MRSSGALLCYFLYCAVGLIDRGVRVGVGFSIGIRDVNLPVRLAPNHARLLVLGEIRIVKRVVLVRVAMRPAIYRDGLDVPRGIETSARKYSSELVAQVALERLKRRPI